MAFRADHDGSCERCGGSIQSGDLVEFRGFGSLEHVDCERAARVVCTTCWLVKPCGCDD